MKLNISVYIALALAGLASCRSYSKLEKSAATENAVAHSPNSISPSQTKEMAMFFDAEKARLLGDTKQAYTIYKSYTETFPGNATAHYNLARLQFQRQELIGAEKNAALAVEILPDNKYFVEFYAQLLSYLKKNKQAETLMNSLVTKDPANEEYLYQQAMFYIREKKYDKAIESFNTLEKVTGFNEDLIIQKKNIYVSQGKTTLAIAELQKLKEAFPASAEYPIMMIDVYNQANLKEKTKSIYEELEKDYATDPHAQVVLAGYYMEEKNTKRANEYMLEVMKNKNLDVDTKIRLLVPSLKMLESDSSEDRERILSMAKTIAEESPNNKEAVGLYGDLLVFAKENDEALVQFKKYLVIDQSKFPIWNQIISLYLEKQEMDSVLYYSNKSIEVFPNNPLPYFFKGIAYMQLKQNENAIKPFNKSLELEPENPALVAQIYSNLGDVYNTQKKYELSDSCFDKALKLQPDDATTLNNYAYYLSLRKSKLNDAERMSKKSLLLMPESKSFLDTYGWILYQQGKYNEAKDYIQKALKATDDDDATLLEHLGDIYFKLNDKEKATELWKRAIRKDVENPILMKKISEGKMYE